MLKCKEFPNLAAILEFAFGESDRVVRAGGGLESDPRPTDTVLISRSRQQYDYERCTRNYFSTGSKRF